MSKNSTIMPGILRVPALVLVFIFCATPGAFAKEWEVVNTPPPMPKEMENTQQPQAAKVYGALPVDTQRSVMVNGKKVVVQETLMNDVGFAATDADGGYVWVPAPVKSMPPGHADARELKLKVRELASQLIANMDPALRGSVALPTSFVNQEDFSQSSPLGRFMAEQLIYEFNQRGFPIREYRIASSIASREGQGEFLLTRTVAPVSTKTKNAVFVVGTYFMDRQAVFVNARLIRGNGDVLRTAQLVLPNSAMTRRMLAGSGKALQRGSLSIQDFKTTTQPTNLTPIDLGADVH